MKKTFALSTLALSIALAGCSDSDDNTPAAIAAPAYTFESQFEAGESSVSYSGQTARQILLADLKSLAASDFAGAADAAAVVAQLNKLYNSNVDADNYTFNKGDSVTLAPAPTYGSISTGKTLQGKMAGVDNASRDTVLKGWASTSADGATLANNASPDDFVQFLFQRIGNNYADNNRTVANGDGSETLTLAPFQSEDGVDLQQLSNKFLLMAVAYSQGTVDYLGDFNGKGINASASQTVKNGSAKTYSALEHAWDEGFGYFGAARDYDQYTDLEIRAKGDGPRGKGYFDTNGDGNIDLGSEINFAAAVNAAKRDVGSAESAKTNFTKDIFDAFVAGRKMITEQGADIDRDDLEQQRDIIVNGWEKVYAATVVHYINDTLQDMNKFGTSDYSFANHAKHWSEMKGFAMGLYFNPNALITEAQLNDFHSKVGDAPVLSTDTSARIAAYKTALVEARGILKAAYNFADANLGDANGENGW